MGKRVMRPIAKAMTQEVKDKLRKQKAMSKLRAKVENGTATEEEVAIVRQAPPPKMMGRRVTKMRAAEAAAEPESFTPPEATSGEAEPVKPPPPPPINSAVSSLGKDMPRHDACKEVAYAYCLLLKKLSEYIESNGSTPLISNQMIDETVMPAAIQVADKLLPANLEITPEVKVVAFSGITMGQAAYVAAKKKRAAKGNLQSVPAMPIPFKVPEPEPVAAQQGEEDTGPPVNIVVPQRPVGKYNLWPDVEQ